MSQQAMPGGGSGGGGGMGQFGDTTFTKVFVGGLAWETHKEGMRGYFEQFGDILEAVVITDKNTGRSKGYGFVTFREPEAALRACIDPYPVIDGRRANCNLAYLGVNKSKTAPVPPYLQLQPYARTHAAHVYAGGNMRAMKSIQTTAGAGGANSMSFLPADHGIQQGIPTYNVYAGYSPYFSDYGYPLSYFQGYGGLQQGAQQYAVFGGGAATAAGLTMAAANPSGLYPYYQYGPANGAAGYSMAQYPQTLYQQYAAAAAVGATTTAATLNAVAGSLQQYAGAAAFTPSNIAQAAGMTMSLTSPTTLPTPTAAQYQYSRLIPSALAAAPDQKPSLA